MICSYIGIPPCTLKTTKRNPTFLLFWTFYFLTFFFFA
uniref:Uncharacterized protein n=1 Tax=Rhizophora mucronata TaxID=61149 RepID=A0A2P2QI15_RHIMU